MKTVKALNPGVSTEKMDSLKSATSSDPLLSRVFDHTLNGWPMCALDVPEQLRLYHVVHGDLSVADDKILYRNRLAIPPTLRKAQ